jgi:predicted enzyme related to lactoylglutathione lyase
LIDEKVKAKYKHTNIVAADWRQLARFYQEVFNCIMVPPERNLKGAWLEKGTGVAHAQFTGAHLRLPGYEEEGPTLEIYQYSQNVPRPPSVANREGITHLAFEVDDVEKALDLVLNHSGKKIGEITSSEVQGVGILTFVYCADPEGNIIELQAWGKRTESSVSPDRSRPRRTL